ncbi:hypothetical protein PFISCL1PPCAC_23299, partial [Pristionchus fissidentatus]
SLVVDSMNTTILAEIAINSRPETFVALFLDNILHETLAVIPFLYQLMIMILMVLFDAWNPFYGEALDQVLKFIHWEMIAHFVFCSLPE